MWDKEIKREVIQVEQPGEKVAEKRKEHEHGAKKASNGCKILCPSFLFLSSSCVSKMVLLNHKMLQQSPLTLPCV